MEHVRGRVLDGEQVLAESIEITAEINQRARSKSWYGCFIVSGPWSPERSGPFRLELEDGRTGEILVTKTKSLDSAETRVFFDGAGPIE